MSQNRLEGLKHAPTELDEFLRIEIIFTSDKQSYYRVPGENLVIFRGVETFMPGSASDMFLDSVVLAPLAQHYKANIEDFNLELRHMKRIIDEKQAKEPCNILMATN